MPTTEGDFTSRSETFYGNEYKALRDEITTKLRDRLEFNRWGLIGIAALYSYIFSNAGKPVLYWVPVALSVAMIVHLNEEHRIVAKAATYIREQIEPWAAGNGKAPDGWEIFLLSRPDPPIWKIWQRWPKTLWGWTPVPLWIFVLGLTLVTAIGVSAGLWPSLIKPSLGFGD
jgi:hypothetical protein